MIALRRVSGASIVVALLVASLGACTGDTNDIRPAAACRLPKTLDSPPEFPADLPWPGDVRLTQAKVNKQFVSVEGYSKRSVEHLFTSVRPHLTRNGFDIINTDYEGFEAELFIAKGDGLAGIVSLREALCDGYVKVNVLYDPLETSAGREAVRKTRKLSGEG